MTAGRKNPSDRRRLALVVHVAAFAVHVELWRFIWRLWRLAASEQGTLL